MELALEKSTNTHVTKSDVILHNEISDMTTMVLEVKSDNLIVEHGHHHTVATEPGNTHVIKITQQEYNPVLKAFNNSYD